MKCIGVSHNLHRSAEDGGGEACKHSMLRQAEPPERALYKKTCFGNVMFPKTSMLKT